MVPAEPEPGELTFEMGRGQDVSTRRLAAAADRVVHQDGRPTLQAAPGLTVDAGANAAHVAVAVEERRPAARERLVRCEARADRKGPRWKPKEERKPAESHPRPRQLTRTAEAKVREKGRVPVVELHADHAATTGVVDEPAKRVAVVLSSDRLRHVDEAQSRQLEPVAELDVVLQGQVDGEATDGEEVVAA